MIYMQAFSWQGGRHGRRGEGGELLLKRQAFHRSIRRQELTSYFTAIRTSLVQAEQLENQAVENAHQLIDELPSSVYKLAQAIDEHLSTTIAALVGRIGEVADKMVRLEVTEWGYYMHILQRLLAHLTPQEAEGVVRHTLMGALECAEILEKRHRKNEYHCQQIAEHCLQYCLRCGRFLAELDPMQLVALVWTIGFIGEGQLAAEGKVALLGVCNNLIGADFDPEEAENIQPQRQMDMESLKVNFIKGVFYGTLPLLQHIVHWAIQALLGEESEEGGRILVQGLRLLVNITNMFYKPKFFYPLLQAQVVHLVNSYLMARKTTYATVLAVRLLNNLLVNEEKLTLAILKEVHLPLLLKAYEQEGLDVQLEVVQLLVNQVYFLNDDACFVRQLVTGIGLHHLLFEFLRHYRELEENLMLGVINALVIAHDHHPTELRAAVRIHCAVLRELAENTTLDTQLIESILLWEAWEEMEHV